MLGVGKPKRWITCAVGTDAFKLRQIDLSWEAPIVLQEGAEKGGTSGDTRPTDAVGVAEEFISSEEPQTNESR